MGAMAQEKEVRGPYRRYTAAFKREQIERVLRGDVTAAELSRELGIARSMAAGEKPSLRSIQMAYLSCRVIWV